MKKMLRMKSCVAGMLFVILLTFSSWAADPNDPNDPNTITTPVFTPDGGTYNTAQTVTITCATPDVTIRYTLDGSDPNTGAIYDPNDPVIIDHSLTLKAVAWKNSLCSTVKSAAYQLVVATPVFTPDGGNYTPGQNVVITCATAGSEIHYTYSNDPNNTPPDPQFTDPVIENGGSIVVSVNPPTCLKARAWKTGFQTSTVKTAIYQTGKYNGGSGTAQDPYRIAFKEALLELAATAEDYNKYFILTADIDLSGHSFTKAPIAPDMDNTSYDFDGTPFSGGFDGNGFVIRNLTINTAGANNDFLGLFGRIYRAPAEIKNLGLEDVNITGGSYSISVGALCGLCEGIITNCYTTGSVNGYNRVGGLVGEYCPYNWSDPPIKNCYSTCTVTGYIFVGGFCGFTFGTLKSCRSGGSVTGYETVGGFCGSNVEIISNCYSTGPVSGYSKIGGLCGSNSYGYITKSYSIGAVTGSSFIGGFIGEISGEDAGGYPERCFWDIETSGLENGIGDYFHDGVTGKTTAQMKTLSTFTSADWDFSNTDGDPADWVFPSPPDYPVLFWEVLPFNPNTVSTPIFSVVGGTYDTPQNVIITCSTSGAAIHYTTNGLDPTESDPVITSGDSVYVDRCLTLKARAWKEGMNPSLVKFAIYQFIARPVFNPDGGVFETDQTVVITCAMPGSTIRYTNDGSDPNNGTIIENGGSIVVSVDPPTILKARAFRDGCIQSNIKTAIYCREKYNGGNGDPNNPYQIATKTNLLSMTIWGDYDKHFILTADIDMEGQVFTTAVFAPDTSAADGFQGTAFTGTFDGDGRKITNFTIHGTNNDYLGLFGYIGFGGKIKNLGIDNSSVTALVTIKSYYGGKLAGCNQGSISNCYANGTVSGQSSYSGGLVGANNSNGIIIDCYVTGDVSVVDYDNGYVGGLAGYNQGSISNCYANSAASGGNSVGGLAGYNQGSISNCYATEGVSGWRYVGGLAGYNQGSISNCYATGAIDGSLYVGGLVGFNGNSIANCYATGAVSGGDDAGGLVGYNQGSINNCYSTGDVIYGNRAGGLVGINYNTISNCYAIGPVHGYDVGGLAGYNVGTISKCYSTGFVSGHFYLGGLIGNNFSTVTGSFWDTQTSGQTTSAGGTGKTTAQMKTLSTFTSAGWDFTDETTNGTNNIWRMCVDGIDYPYLNWESIDGDWACPDGVNIEDLDYFITEWLLDNCASGNNYCGGVDIDTSGKVNMEDFSIFAEHWLEGL